jgi:hypothetical protein
MRSWSWNSEFFELTPVLNASSERRRIWTMFRGHPRSRHQDSIRLSMSLLSAPLKLFYSSKAGSHNAISDDQLAFPNRRARWLSHMYKLLSLKLSSSELGL